MLDADTIIATLRAHRPELEAMGVRHAALFGSRARGDAGPESDIDIGLRFAPEMSALGLRYFGLRQTVEDRLETLFAQPVDVSDEDMLRDTLKPFYERDKILAF